ncbi:prolyl oligopeptidase family serine peptidase [Sphingobacterium sp. lm-10]|uniref:S9 family peptidase n=1 Tax=Sphingobacterium sp. lm-10 TaxID=2944904 RepID=UPI002021A884|nr:prolyl oligopeptidase family serine peptidase [Sphingobacterium sp. lm-10]MCL7989260.1 prolyl oligopeptidase family serine peptidase [Sphingobacterium sp. lm-10]
MNFRYKYINYILLSFSLFLHACGSGVEQNEVIPVEDFIFKSERSNFKLSPDGSMIAYLGMHDHCKNIFIMDLEDDDKSKQLTYQDDLNVQSFHWANDSTIVFSNSHYFDDVLRLFAVDVATDSIQQLLEPVRSRLKFTQPIRDYQGAIYASINMRDSSVFDLYKIFLDGRTPELVYKNPGMITSWIPSPDGVVRLALTSDSVQESILYRANEQQKFEEIAVYDFKTSVNPLGYLGESTRSVVAMSNQNRDKFAIVEYDVSTGKEVREIFADSDVDVNNEGYSHQLHRQLFATTSACRKNYTFFDSNLHNTYKTVQQHFKGYAVDFLDMDPSLQHFIIRVYSDVRPGEVYYYNSSKNQFTQLMTAFPGLKEADMLPMEPVKFNARDNKEINGFITYPKGRHKNCPLVVLVHDGPSRRDDWGFNPEVQFLANRGYAVFQINYRGTMGYGKAFWSSGFREWGGRIQSDITDGVTWLIHEGKADKNRMAIMGTGFGGYSALHAASFNPSMYKCIISSSGYSNLFTYFKEIPPHLKPYVQMYYQIIGNPEREAEFFKTISPLFHAGKVKKPVLFFQGGKDKYTSVTDANQFVARLKQNNVPVRYIFKEDEGRRFKSEENMTLYFQEVESFLKQYLH